MYRICFIFLVFITQDCSSQEEDEGPYKGKHIGKLNSYHHQVSGDVYAVDDWTLLLVDFNYDGTGDDTFFWAGDSGRPGPLGFIVPDQYGKTNILERYNNEEIRLKLPDGKRVSRITWFAVYDLASQSAFGDVYVPEEFSAPAPRALTPLTPAPAAQERVSSKPVIVEDASTILIPEFHFQAGSDEVYFWMGVGPQPSARGTVIPDEDGYLEPLRSYGGADVRLRLPGGRTVFDVDWVALWEPRAGAALAAALLPDALNVPPAARRLHPHRSQLPHCKQLHRDLQVSWEVFGNQITIQLAGMIGANEYMAFGISGSDSRSQMEGADVAVASFDAALQRGDAPDYNVTAPAPCVQVLGQWRGVCRDARIGGSDANQVFSASRQDGLTVVSFRRQLQPSEEMDKEWRTDRSMFVVWAVGPLDHVREPAFHRLYPRADVQLVLARAAADSDCVPFVMSSEKAPAGWERAALFDPALRVFDVRLGPAGGARGLAARRPAAPAAALYVNGQLAPDLQLRRGLAYTFRVWTGDDPHSATLYHPLVLTSEPHGGLERLADGEQRAARVLAGARHTRRGRLSPAAAGPLCRADLDPGADRRRDAWDSFRAFNRSLRWSCARAPPAELTVTPNSTWPDLVYYHSFTHFDMGGRIFIVDRHRRNIARSHAHTHAHTHALALSSVLALVCMLSAQ
ncbi:protein Skeletor, isoforms B/C [Zerene cesonia]|uniref:protein Skeletor, isoforms B/C n=1 Tax=Zerene cesonia TaxID=33412 RepID=UPI0018E56E6C|nr:protein Skeletor, isoforms B/C [Zerene cesonia]